MKSTYNNNNDNNNNNNNDDNNTNNNDDSNNNNDNKNKNNNNNNEKISEKNEEPYHITITWIRTMLSFEILRSVHTCVRGSRTPFHKIPQEDLIDDCRLNANQAGVR